MKKPSQLCILAGGLMFALLSTGLSAQTLSLLQTGISHDYTITVNTTGATAETGYDEMQVLTVSNQSAGLNLPSTIDAFCVELGQFSPDTVAANYAILSSAAAISLQGVTDTRGALDTLAGITTSGIGPTRAANLALLYGFKFGGTYNPETMSTYDQAVFQAAVWQLSHSDSFTLASGDPGFFFTNPSVGTLLTDTQNLLNQVQANSLSVTPMNLTVLHSEGSQDFLLPEQIAFAAIPEPSTYAALLGLGALGLAALRRRTAISI
jgi:hypothetical protein